MKSYVDYILENVDDPAYLTEFDTIIEDSKFKLNPIVAIDDKLRDIEFSIGKVKMCMYKSKYNMDALKKIINMDKITLCNQILSTDQQ